MKSYNQSYGQPYKKQKSGANIVMWALIISWTIIFAGVWRVFFRSAPTPPTNIIDSEANSGAALDGKTTYYMGEKILASGVLAPTESFTTYTHDFVSDKGDLFGLKSKDIDLYTFEGKVQLKGSITDFKGDLPIISVTEIIADTSQGNGEDAEIDDNPGFYLFKDKGLGFDMSISEGYSAKLLSDGNIALIDDTAGGDAVLTINTFVCTPGDSSKDCLTLQQRFKDIGSDTFISSNNVTFYNLTETITWVAFHPSGKFGYYITPRDEKDLIAFVNLMSFLDEAALTVALQDSLPNTCKDLNYSMTAIDDVSFVYEDNGIAKATLVSEDEDGVIMTCVLAIRLGNILKVTPVSFTVDEEKKNDGEEKTADKDEEEDATNDEKEKENEKEKQAITPPSTNVSVVPEDWENLGWFRYVSVRGYNVYFSSKSVSYAGEILETPTDLGVDGLKCIYKIGLVPWKNADQVDTNPDVEVYECTGSPTQLVGLQKVGQVEDYVFIAKWYTTNLGDMKIVVEGQEGEE